MTRPLKLGWQVWLAGLVLALGPAARSRADTEVAVSLERRLVALGYYPVTLEQTFGKLTARGVIDGRSRTLIVDTGWSWTSIDQRVGSDWKSPRELGTTVTDPVFGRLSNLPWTKDKFALMPALFLGGVVFSNQPVVVQKLDSLQLLQEGVLGCDFLLRNYAILDCGRRRLYVRERPPNAETRAVVQKTFWVSHFRPVALKLGPVLGVTCDADLNGNAITLLVDTGADATIVDRTTAQQCNVSWSKKGEAWKIRGFKGRNSRIYPLDPVSFYLGSWPVSAKAVKVADLSDWNLGAKGNSPTRVDGLLGFSELVREGALLDLAAGTLWLKPDAVSALRAVMESERF